MWFACPTKSIRADLNTFADPSNGGDLRFYNEDNQELIYEVDE